MENLKFSARGRVGSSPTIGIMKKKKRAMLLLPKGRKRNFLLLLESRDQKFRRIAFQVLEDYKEVWKKLAKL